MSFHIGVEGQNELKSQINQGVWHYEIEGIAEAKDGNYLVKVWSFSTKPRIAVDVAKKNAVHGIIFKGYSGVSNKISSQPPFSAIQNLEIEKHSFFEVFFGKNGAYSNYAEVLNEGAISPGDLIKVDKKYKIGLIVLIKKDDLRNYLVKEGIIPSLDSGF